MASPLSEFQKDKASRWTVMLDIPAWEKDAMFRWIEYVVHEPVNDSWGNNSARFSQLLLERVQRRERILLSEDLGLDTYDWNSLYMSLLSKYNDHNFRDILFFIELLIKYIRDTKGNYDNHSDRHAFSKVLLERSEILEILENQLQNGSKWRVVFEKNNHAGLIERVDASIVDTAKSINIDTLSDAWSLAYGLNPNSSLAIEKAQKAIEHVASENGLTKLTTSVYGGLLGDIRTHKSRSYATVASNEFQKIAELSSKADTKIHNIDLVSDNYMEWFATTMDLIQKSNPVRHGSNKVKNFSVSSDTAKQAVLMATVICEIMQKRYIYIRKRKYHER